MSTTVLVVDDEQVNREILSRMLVKHGYTPTAVDGGSAALGHLANCPTDIVLLDVVMPDMDGFECLHRIREIYPIGELPVIMVTAESDRERIVAAFRAGANDYVTKPIDRELTLARIATQAQLRQTLRALRESEERYALAARGANDGLWDWNVRTSEIYYSPRWKSMLGYLDHEITTESDEWLKRIHPSDRSNFLKALQSGNAQGMTNLECELRMLHKDGTYRWMLCRGVHVRDGQGSVYRMAGSLTDITEGKVGDPLTGLPNRLFFVDRLERAIERSKRTGNGNFGVLFLDLDNFKLINDSLGHQAGDQLLITIARRLEESLRASDGLFRTAANDTVARHAGDEFTILLESLANPHDAEIVAARVLEAISGAVQIEDMEVFPAASIGVAVGDKNTSDAEELLRQADTAMYHAKSDGRNRYRYFDPGMRHHATERLELENDLRHALQQGEFLLHYQPLFDLQTHRPVGFETLLRWKHATRGVLLPSQFIRLAEDLGLIVPLGWWALERACEQAALWNAQFPHRESVFVSVNCSRQQIYHPDFIKRCDEILRRSGVDPGRIWIEVTENTLMESPDTITTVLRDLRSIGVGVGIDDFGTGYSSLAYLHRYPLNSLKIDRSFVNTMHEVSESYEIVRTIIELARSLKLSVVAEGVETPAQRDQLRTLGCHLAQGYLWSPPVGQSAASEFLQDGTSVAHEGALTFGISDVVTRVQSHVAVDFSPSS